MFINLSNLEGANGAPLKKILIADDEEDIRNVLSDFLESSYLIKTAKNGKEAVELTREWKPDLILMDVKMPLMDGLEASRIILSQVKLPIIAITAFQGSVKNQVEQLGLYYLRKPFRLNILLKKIQILLSNNQ